MSLTVQNYLADAAEKAAVDLLAAYHRLPEDKRNWAPSEKTRSAANQVAECAIINGGLVGMLESKTVPADAMAKFPAAIGAMLADLSQLEPALKENTAQLAAKIRTLSDEELAVVIQMPWGPRTVLELISLPFWNMSYHEGQINLLSMLMEG
ncbi:MAG: DinB family protein [Capsulimonadales bacterium]|nr:DinB family protein [Capsulimonadales bacterium]